MCVAAMRAAPWGRFPAHSSVPEQVRQQVAEVRSRSNGPLNLNFFCHQDARTGR